MEGSMIYNTDSILPFIKGLGTISAMPSISRGRKYCRMKALEEIRIFSFESALLSDHLSHVLTEDEGFIL